MNVSVMRRYLILLAVSFLGIIYSELPRYNLVGFIDVLPQSLHFIALTGMFWLNKVMNLLFLYALFMIIKEAIFVSKKS